MKHQKPSVHVAQEQYHINPLPTIGNSLKKQKSLYKVSTPSIKAPIQIYYGLMGAHDAYMRHWWVKGYAKSISYSPTVLVNPLPTIDAYMHHELHA